MLRDYTNLAIFSTYLIQTEVALIGFNTPFDWLMQKYGLIFCVRVFFNLV